MNCKDLHDFFIKSNDGGAAPDRSVRKCKGGFGQVKE